MCGERLIDGWGWSGALELWWSGIRCGGGQLVGWKRVEEEREFEMDEIGIGKYGRPRERERGGKARIGTVDRREMW